MRFHLGEVVGVKRKIPSIKTMIDDLYKDSTYPAFDIVGKVTGVDKRSFSTDSSDKYEIRLNKANDCVRVYDFEIYKLANHFSDEDNLFDEYIGKTDIRCPYTYLGAFADYVFSKRNEEGQHWLSTRIQNSVVAETGIQKTFIKINKDIEDSIRYSIPRFILPKEALSEKELRYAIADAKATKEVLNTMFGVPKFEYKKIIFSGPCTIVLWADGTKTIAKANKDELFDPEKGVAVCFMKRALGETEGKKVLRKASKDYYDETHVTFDDIQEFLKNLLVPKENKDEELKRVEPTNHDKFVKFVDGGYKRYCVDCVYGSKENDEYPCCGCFYDNSHPAWEDKKKEKKDE